MPPLTPHRNINLEVQVLRRLRNQEICTVCIRVTPHTAHCWDPRRNMCRPCAMDEAEREGHQRARLTLRLPPRAHKRCALCQSDFVVPLPLPNANENDDPSVIRCAPCRRSEKCSKCRKVKKRKHFRKESGHSDFYKTCASCREKGMLRIHQKRAQAEIQGEYMCTPLVCTH